MKKSTPSRSPRRQASSPRDTTPTLRSPTALVPPTLQQVASMADLSQLALSGDASKRTTSTISPRQPVQHESVDIAASPRLELSMSIDPDVDKLGCMFSDRSEEPTTPTLTRKFKPMPRPSAFNFGGVSEYPAMSTMSPKNLLTPRHPHFAHAFSLHAPGDNYSDGDAIDDIFGPSGKAGPQWDRVCAGLLAGSLLNLLALPIAFAVPYGRRRRTYFCGGVSLGALFQSLIIVAFVLKAVRV